MCYMIWYNICYTIWYKHFYYIMIYDICEQNSIWSWPWTELSVKHYLNQFLRLWVSTWRKFWSKSAIFEVSTAHNLKIPDVDLWPDLDLTRDPILKLYGRFKTIPLISFERRVAHLTAISRSRVRGVCRPLSNSRRPRPQPMEGGWIPQPMSG